MLRQISINNVALISSLSIDLSKGFSVISGETGAGKSLIVGSIALLLGEKADKSIVSVGQKVATVEAVFETDNETVLNKMQELGLEKENTLIVSRHIFSDGKSDIRVNGKLFTLTMLKELTSFLVDLHGQFEHQSLLKVSNHIKILDDFAKVSAIKKKLAEELDIVYATRQEINQFGGSDDERERKIDLLKFQIDEISSANFEEGEEEVLKEKHAQIHNQEKILNALKLAISFLSGDGEFDPLFGITNAAQSLKTIGIFDEKFEIISERLTSSKIEISDCLDTIKDYADSFLTLNDAEKIEDRLDLLKKLKRKYGNDISEINSFCDKASAELSNLNNATETILMLKNKLDTHLDKAIVIANELSQKRKTSAIKFQGLIEKEMSDLCMKNAKFVVNIERKSEKDITKNGLDDVEFLLTVNAGVPVRALAKIVSGGEMSRFMLAIKNVTSDIDGIESLIFDEIDTGISGLVGRVVGEKMVSISRKHQVLCVTHLPQIAVFSDSHFLISKDTKNGKTETHLQKLNKQSKITEIERLVGGFESGIHAKLHAEELLDNAEKFKQNLK